MPKSLYFVSWGPVADLPVGQAGLESPTAGEYMKPPLAPYKFFGHGRKERGGLDVEDDLVMRLDWNLG